jgi:hypothetical protein
MILMMWMDGFLTANTLNSEVLPAFWRPIIVISISVALASRAPGQHGGYFVAEGENLERMFAFCLQQIIADPASCIDPTAELTRTTAATNRTRV